MAIIDTDTPYVSGKNRAICIENPVYDLIIGNVDGVRDANDPNPNEKKTTSVRYLLEVTRIGRRKSLI